ncbi:MAG TPA: hypothetical protein VI485_31070 [Vicinamibacterales bacterium]|nr:hypothetical protein [Vicinamibacterales bacterium]
MSVADDSGPTNDRQLARYLLGLLPHDKTEWLDEASIVDDEVALRLRVPEHDLVDAYVTGTLAGDMLEPFESRYLASLRRRQHVGFARRFLRAVDRVAHANTENRSSQMAPRTRLSPRWIAAAALLLVASGTLLFQAVRLQTGLDVARTERIVLDSRARALEQQLTEQQATNAAVTRELERVRESAAAAAPRSARDTQTIALVLQPQTRAVGPVATLAIPPGVDRLAFALRLESNDLPRYRVVLKDPASDRPVWTSDPIEATMPGEMPTVAVVIPTRLLKPQHYSLVLSGASGSGGDVVGSYTFQIVRR